jgi:hypothetical protein
MPKGVKKVFNINHIIVTFPFLVNNHSKHLAVGIKSHWIVQHVYNVQSITTCIFNTKKY